MPDLRLSVTSRDWQLREPFVISRQVVEHVSTIEVMIEGPDGIIGRGSAVGLDYAGETVATMLHQIEQVRSVLEAAPERSDLLQLMSAGGARAAVDAAFWDLSSKRDGLNPFARSGLRANPVRSSITIGLCAPAEMEWAARRAGGASTLKLKLGADHPLEIVAAARRGAPHSRFIVDPNQAWDINLLKRIAPELAAFGVDLIEQPIPVGAEQDLDGYRCPVPICADEACDGIDDLAKLAGRFDAVNIKLDKAGGLTAALQLADAAEASGMELMVGCMLSPSRGIAPAMVLAQRCRWVDLDAPPFLTEDDADGFLFENGLVREPYKPNLWG